MHTLATAMREYIHTQDSTNLDNYLKELVTETIGYGKMSMEELQRSIYSLNEAVSLITVKISIKGLALV